MTSKYLILGLCLVGMGFAADPTAEAVPIRVFVERPAKLRMVEYERPLLFDYGKLREGFPVPEWYPAFHAYRRVNEFNYEEWIKFFTPGALKAMPIESEAAFLAFKKRYNPETFSIKEASALYAVYVSFEERELCFVLFHRGHVLSSPADMKELKVTPSTLIFEKVDRSWKLQDIGQTDWAFGLSPTQRDKIRTMLKSGEAYVRPDKTEQPTK